MIPWLIEPYSMRGNLASGGERPVAHAGGGLPAMRSPTSEKLGCFVCRPRAEGVLTLSTRAATRCAVRIPAPFSTPSSGTHAGTERTSNSPQHSSIRNCDRVRGPAHSLNCAANAFPKGRPPFPAALARGIRLLSSVETYLAERSGGHVECCEGAPGIPPLPNSASSVPGANVKLGSGASHSFASE